MLSRPKPNVALFRERACAARKRAESCIDEKDQEFYLRIEQKWLKIADDFEGAQLCLDEWARSAGAR